MNLVLTNIFSSPFYLSHIIFSALIGYWIYLDATERGSDANLLWALGCTFIQPLILGYLLYRSEIGGRTEPAGVTERVIGTVVIGQLVTEQLWFGLRFTGIIASRVYPPAVELQYYVALFAVGVIPGYWLVWKRGWARIRREFGWVQESERATVQN
ncbi:hypothetical protein [Haladaptatus caseinilyticus]|uniref:hypothetical protein n=1 Tax=Haladaptatus caseinilyticus TaxID=2993314 RepID=UPI00224A7E5A|nr:hypothetical protein [Haladaptatus caseinilyticus]